MGGRRFVKLVKRRVPWLEHVIERGDEAGDLNVDEALSARVPSGSLCVRCKASRMLCGKPTCPILVKLRAYLKVEPQLRGLSVEGTSPPAVFVGRLGYPYVDVGPLVPPVRGDTSIYDSPERWLHEGVDVEGVVEMRMRLVRGRHRVHVEDAEGPDRLLEAVQEAALSARPVDAEMELKSRPRASIILDDDVQPIGPSAPMEDVRVEVHGHNAPLERVYGDADLKAEEAIMELYRRGVPITQIQRALSVGLMGVRGRRRLVPTRWSITAVDSIVSRRLIEDEVKHMEELSEYRVYSVNVMGNEFVVLMLPGKWSYESIEAWCPGTAWNPEGGSVAFCGDWEGYHGRTSYASMGGCYYAARLAVAEALIRERRQAQVLVLREARPSYIMPVGVWIVREAVREALRRRPKAFNTAEEALSYAFSRMLIKPEEWFKVSWTLDQLRRQERLTKYLRG